MSEETCFWAIILFFASFFSCRVPSFAWLCPMPNKTTAIPVQHLRRFEDPIVVNSKSQSHSIGVLAFPTLCHDLKCFIRRPNSWTNMTKPMVSSAVCFWLCLYVWEWKNHDTCLSWDNKTAPSKAWIVFIPMCLVVMPICLYVCEKPRVSVNWELKTLPVKDTSSEN